MRKRHGIVLGAATAVALMGVIAASPAAATPTLFPGQVDGVFVTNGVTIVQFNQLDESHEAFFSQTSFTAPTNFTDATIYLTENNATTCTPSPGTFSLGDCSDGLTITNDPLNGHLDISFVSDGATLDELTQFFGGISTNVSMMPETGQWQDVSSTFGQAAGFAFVQSDIDTVVPEPISLSLFGAGLLGSAAARRRKANRAV